MASSQSKILGMILIGEILNKQFFSKPELIIENSNHCNKENIEILTIEVKGNTVT